MTDEQVEKSKAAIESAHHISPDKKSDLLDSLSKLKPALGELSQTHSDDARNIAGVIESSAEEASRPKKRPGRLEELLGELRQSVEKFEASHPTLMEIVLEYSNLLAEMGL